MIEKAMANGEENWSNDDAARVDGGLKMQAGAHEIALALDRLFFASDEKDVVKKLKEAGPALAKVKDSLPEELRPKWASALSRQLRTSVERVKKNAGRT
jgi:hypothetical protein